MRSSSLEVSARRCFAPTLHGLGAAVFLLTGCAADPSEPYDQRQDAASDVWTKIAAESQTFVLGSSQVVRYGAGSTWIQKTINGSFTCSNGYFGQDPAPSVVKECDVAAAWVKAAGEYQKFTVATTQTVRYGAGSSWVQKTVSGTVSCNNTFFGQDPAHGLTKECDVLGPASSPPPSDGPAAAIVATRVSGTAPLAVLFDATGTTAPAGTDAFRQLNYTFDFGDDRGLTWAVSGMPKNQESGGPIAAHVFDVAGTFTVKVRATDGNGQYSEATVQVTVSDPNTVYAGTKTICVSPSGNYTGCPSGAAQKTSLPTAWSGERVLLHRGESFSAIGIQDGNTGVQVGAYGTGAAPVVASVGVGSWRPATAAFASDVTVMDLDVKDGLWQSLGARVLFYRNRTSSQSSNLAMSFGGEYYWYGSDPLRTVDQSAFYNAREIFLVENDARGPDTSTISYGAFGSGSRVALLGNTFGRQQYHSVRITALNKGIIAHNEMQGISASGTMHSLKLHSDGLSSYADGFINPPDGVSGWASSQIVVTQNLFGNAADNNQWIVAVSPQNDEYAEGLEDVIIAANRFVRGPNAVQDLTLGGRRLTYRGNTVVGGGTLSEGIGHAGALPAAWNGPYYSQ